MDGRTIEKCDQQVELKITSHYPEKWFFIDGQSGNMYVGSPRGLRKVSLQDMHLLLKVIGEALYNRGINDTITLENTENELY